MDEKLSEITTAEEQIPKKKCKKLSTGKIVAITISAVIVAVLLLNLVIMPLTGKLERNGAKESFVSVNTYMTENNALISAHRAGGDLAPEETLMAFQLCMTAEDYEVDIVEFDLHLTADDKLILLHDDTLDRTSDATEFFGEKKIKARDKTLAELKQLNFGENFETLDGKFPYRGLRGEQIPNEVKVLTLDEILDYLISQRGDRLNYIIEIKDGGEDGEKAMDILYSVMQEKGITDRTVVGTFQGNVTDYIDLKYPTLNRSASIAEVLEIYFDFLYGMEKKQDAYKYNVLQIPKGFGPLNLGTKAFVDYAHSYGIAVQYWTINDAEQIKLLAENGADAIITDNPEVAYRVLRND